MKQPSTIKVGLPGSVRFKRPGARMLGAAPAQERVQVSVRLRARAGAPPLLDYVAALGSQMPRQRQYLSREEFARRFGASLADVAKVEAFAHQHSLRIVRVDLAARTLRLEGCVAGLRRGCCV